MKKKKEKVNYKEIWMNLKRTWKFTKPYRSKMIFYIIFSLLLTVAGVLIPLVSAKMLINISNGLFDKLIIFSATYFFIHLIRNVFRYVSSKISEYIYLSTLLDIQVAITSEILDLEVQELDKNSSGVFVERLKGDSNSLAVIFERLLSSISDMLGNVGILVAVFIINKIVFVYFVIVVVILWLLEQQRIKSFFKVDAIYRKQNENNTGLTTELVRGIRDIKVLNIKKSFLGKMSEDMRTIFDKKTEMHKISRVYNLLTDSIEYFSDFLFIILGIWIKAKS